MLTLFVCPNTILAEGPAKYLSSALLWAVIKTTTTTTHRDIFFDEINFSLSFINNYLADNLIVTYHNLFSCRNVAAANTCSPFTGYIRGVSACRWRQRINQSRRWGIWILSSRILVQEEAGVWQCWMPTGIFVPVKKKLWMPPGLLVPEKWTSGRSRDQSRRLRRGVSSSYSVHFCNIRRVNRAF